MANLFKLEVHTPYRLFFSDQVEAFVVTIPDGEIGVRARRMPFAAPLEICALKILDSGGVWKEAAVTTGIVEVKRDGAVILASSAEWPEEIDRERAENAKRRAEERLGEDLMRFESARAKSSYARAVNRLGVLSRANAK